MEFKDRLKYLIDNVIVNNKEVTLIALVKKHQYRVFHMKIICLENKYRQ